MTPQPTFPLSRWERGSGGEAGDRSMTDWPSYVAAVLSGVLAATLAFYVWGRRVERRASGTSPRLPPGGQKKPTSGPPEPRQKPPGKLCPVGQGRRPVRE